MLVFGICVIMAESVIEMQIAAFDSDELADGSGNAAITWISEQVKAEEK